MADFTINGYAYRSSPIDAMTQLFIVRRLAPVLGAITEIIPAVSLYKAAGGDMGALANIMLVPGAEAEGANVAAHQAVMSKAIDAFGKALGSLDDESTSFIIRECLKRCTRRKADSNGDYVQVWNATANTPQHLDINMGTMLRISWNVLQAELSGFFPDRTSTASEVQN